MTTEKTEQKNEREEECAAMDCCSPERFAEMKAKCGAKMLEMMKGQCCQPKDK